MFEELFGVTQESIFCVQCFPFSGFSHITFWTKADMQTCWIWQAKKAGNTSFKYMTFLCSEDKQHVPVMVHMYGMMRSEPSCLVIATLYQLGQIKQMFCGPLMNTENYGSNLNKISMELAGLSTHLRHLEANCGTLAKTSIL